MAEDLLDHILDFLILSPHVILSMFLLARACGVLDIPHQWRLGLLVFLYDFGQSLPLELVLEVELSPKSTFLKHKVCIYCCLNHISPYYWLLITSYFGSQIHTNNYFTSCLLLCLIVLSRSFWNKMSPSLDHRVQSNVAATCKNIIWLVDSILKDRNLSRITIII